jgi:hypothetical protein
MLLRSRRATHNSRNFMQVNREGEAQGAEF